MDLVENRYSDLDTTIKTQYNDLLQKGNKDENTFDKFEEKTSNILKAFFSNSWLDYQCWIFKKFETTFGNIRL